MTDIERELRNASHGQLCREIARLRALNAELVETLERFADHARDRVADAPEWRDMDTVQLVVFIKDLRAVLSALSRARAENTGGDSDG